MEKANVAVHPLPFEYPKLQKREGSLSVDTGREMTRAGEETRPGGKEYGGRASEREKESVGGLLRRPVAAHSSTQASCPAFQAGLFYLRRMSRQPSGI